MHFKATMTVALHKSIRIDRDSGPIDADMYMIVLGVNAPNLATAATMAHDVALRPKQSDGTFRPFEGFVVKSTLERIEKTDLDSVILERAKRIDDEGVYYSTGLIFIEAGNSDDESEDVCDVGALPSSIRGYLLVTGALFASLALAHLLRSIVERSRLTTDPWFWLVGPEIGVMAAAICFWAWRLLLPPNPT